MVVKDVNEIINIISNGLFLYSQLANPLVSPLIKLINDLVIINKYQI